ncbi:hypothetical protein JHN61_15395, partial [Streptomyces sp. MBT67]|nr:hypothetical protein [Streptomyces sp. MBT67]
MEKNRVPGPPRVRTRVRHQMGQQLELQVREVEDDAVDRGRTPGGVDPDRTGRHPLGTDSGTGGRVGRRPERGTGDGPRERGLLIGRHEHQVTDHRRLAGQRGQGVRRGRQPGGPGREEARHVGRGRDLVAVDRAQPVPVRVGGNGTGGDGAGGG